MRLTIGDAIAMIILVVACVLPAALVYGRVAEPSAAGMWPLYGYLALLLLFLARHRHVASTPRWLLGLAGAAGIALAFLPGPFLFGLAGFATALLFSRWSMLLTARATTWPVIAEHPRWVMALALVAVIPAFYVSSVFIQFLSPADSPIVVAFAYFSAFAMLVTAGFLALGLLFALFSSPRAWLARSLRAASMAGLAAVYLGFTLGSGNAIATGASLLMIGGTLAQCVLAAVAYFTWLVTPLGQRIAPEETRLRFHMLMLGGVTLLVLLFYSAQEPLLAALFVPKLAAIVGFMLGLLWLAVRSVWIAVAHLLSRRSLSGS